MLRRPANIFLFVCFLSLRIRVHLHVYGLYIDSLDISATSAGYHLSNKTGIFTISLTGTHDVDVKALPLKYEKYILRVMNLEEKRASAYLGSNLALSTVLRSLRVHNWPNNVEVMGGERKHRKFTTKRDSEDYIVSKPQKLVECKHIPS